MMIKFNREEVYNETLKYFDNDTLATNVWINKYALKDSEGNIYEKCPDDMHKRIAEELSKIEQKYPNPLSEEEIYDLLKNFKYIIPGGSAMAGIGNDLQVTSISNCFVVGNECDSYGGIIKTDEEQVQLMKRRGGVGHDLSHIRPKGSPVKNSALTSTGIVPFMERYSNSTREVAQDGRRGALLLSLHCKHPDLEDFINAKFEEGKITGANISIKITNEFLDCIINNKEFEQQFPITGEAKFKKKINPKDIWNKLIYNNWKNAEPGILFIDNLDKGISEEYPQYKGITTNPCVVGDTLVLTNIGWIKINNLEKWKDKYSDIKIITQDKNGILFTSELDWVGITNHKDEIYKISFDNGEYILVNSKHKLYDKDFNQILICDIDLQNNKEISILGVNNKLLKVIDIFKTNLVEDVYDLTAIPNYNFFSILNRKEIIVEDDIILNDNLKLKYFDIVNTKLGQKFAYKLVEGDEII